MKFISRNFPSTDELKEFLKYDRMTGIVSNMYTDDDISEFDIDTGEYYIHWDGGFLRIPDAAWILIGRTITDGTPIVSLHLDEYPLHSEFNLAPSLCNNTYASQPVVNIKVKTKGYYFDKVCEKWRVQLCTGGKRISGGLFDDELEAQKKVAYLQKKIARGEAEVEDSRKKRALPKYIYESGSKYKVVVNIKGKTKYLGTYDDIGDAVIRRDEVLPS